jgi:drug/metabolite transporter (DMT)-like permease
VNDRRVGIALCLVSAAGFGSLAIFGKQAYAGGLGVVEVLALRFGIAGPLLVALAVAGGRTLRLPRPVAVRLLGLGAIGYAVQSTLFFTALTRISASLAGLLLYLYPALVTVGAVVLGRHRLDRATVLGVVLALGGVALVLGLPAATPDPLGVALALAAACWYTIYILVAEYLLRGVDPLVASAHVACGAACSFLAAAGVVGLEGLAGARPGGYAAAAAMAVLGTAVALGTFIAGIARVGSAWASIVSSFEPVCTVALGVAVLGDPLGAGTVLGGVAVVAAAMLLPLLGRDQETIGSSRRGSPGDVDGAASPVVSTMLNDVPRRGFTRR